MSASTRHLVYLGWQGNRNFGDELLHETWKAALDHRLDIAAPLSRGGYLRGATGYARSRRTVAGGERLLLLGGGTTIGFGTWARSARLARRMFGTSGLLVPGAGAAESGDGVLLSRQPHDWPAWRAQPDLALFGVRGPLTAIECEREGLPAPVIGDPALLYPRHVAVIDEGRSRGRRDGSLGIGLCLGSEGSSRFDIAAVHEGVAAAARETGLPVTLFQLTPADAPAIDELAARFGTGTRIVSFDGDVRATMRAIAGCRVLVSERLHGVVAAVACGVPAVPLAYASKCDDFWMSITGERARLKPELHPAELENAVREAVAQDARVDAAIRERLHRLADALDHVAGALRRWLAGDLATASLLRLPAFSDQ